MGYFKIDRQIFNHWLWDDKPFSKGQAWIDLIGLANYEDGKTLYHGEIVACKRGTVYRSISFLADRWGWSRKKARAFIELLESDEMITAKVTKKGTTITLMNYGKFQDKGATEGTLEEHQRNNRGSNEKRRIKKNKEINNARANDVEWQGFLQMVRESEEKENDSN